MNCYYCEAKTNCPKKHGQKCPYEEIKVEEVKTKKLRDLTIQEIKTLCKKHSSMNSCGKCPLQDIDYMNIPMLSEEELDKDIDL